MINFFKSFKNLFLTKEGNLNDNQSQVPDLKNNPNNKNQNQPDLLKQISSIPESVNSKIGSLIEEFKTIREKCQDLPKTNYNLGMKYLDDGNLKEAILRFKIIKKFWPKYYDAHYQLAYCLIIDGKFKEAQTVLENLLKINPDYTSKVEELFEIIEEELSSDL